MTEPRGGSGSFNVYLDPAKGEWLDSYEGVRTVGDLNGLQKNKIWESFLTCSSQTSVYCLTLAMGAVGLGASLSQMRQLGWRPLCLVFAAAVLVGDVSIPLIRLLGRVVEFS